MRAPFSFLKAAAGGGGGAWYDSADPATLISSSVVDPSTGARFGKVTPTVSGSCTKLRMWTTETAAGAYDMKLALYATDGTLLGTGTIVGTSTNTTDRWIDVTMTAPAAVVALTEYRVGFFSSTALWGRTAALLGQPSGTSYTTTITYANFGVTSAGSYTASTSQLGVGMYIE
jgi:hypothetical protein